LCPKPPGKDGHVRVGYVRRPRLTQQFPDALSFLVMERRFDEPRGAEHAG
jgi:hypothetical protein